jgi:hypothetical protein
MLEFCSMLTILPDYLYRRLVQGKRFGKEITLFSVWFELRYGIVTCLMLTISLITLIFYFHPSPRADFGSGDQGTGSPVKLSRAPARSHAAKVRRLTLDKRAGFAGRLLLLSTIGGPNVGPCRCHKGRHSFGL